MERSKNKKEMEQDGIQGAGLSAKERLAKIEEKLDNILGKLDNKADKADFVELERRVRDIETHGTTQFQQAINEMRSMKDEFTIQTAELVKGQSKIKASIAYIMGAAAAVVVIIELIIRK
jgi:tetrahydromethanopterin S-methyltransferase subunit G